MTVTGREASQLCKDAISVMFIEGARLEVERAQPGTLTAALHRYIFRSQ